MDHLHSHYPYPFSFVCSFPFVLFQLGARCNGFEALLDLGFVLGVSLGIGQRTINVAHESLVLDGSSAGFSFFQFFQHTYHQSLKCTAKMFCRLIW